MQEPIERAGKASDSRPSFQDRLRIERERLGISQEAFANLGGVGKSSQWMYEQGRHWPTAEYLESLRQHQVDVGYLATGIRHDSETLRHALGFVLKLARQEGRNFSDEQLFSVFLAVIEAASGVTLPDLGDRDATLNSLREESDECRR